MPIDRKIMVDSYKHKFTKAKMFDIPLSEMTADELRACVCILGEALKKKEEEDKKKGK